MNSVSRIFRSPILLFSLGILAIIGFHYSPANLLQLTKWSEHYWMTTVVALLGIYLVRPFFMWPLSLFSVFIGYTFGFPWGVPLVLFGTLLTSFPPFLIATRTACELKQVDWIAERGATLVHATGELRGMIASRISPAPADAVSYGAGIAGVSPRAFAVGTLVGELPWAIFYILLGQSLRKFTSTSVRQTPVGLLLLTAVISVLLVARPLYELSRNRTIQDDETSA